MTQLIVTNSNNWNKFTVGNSTTDEKCKQRRTVIIPVIFELTEADVEAGLKASAVIPLDSITTGAPAAFMDSICGIFVTSQTQYNNDGTPFDPQSDLLFRFTFDSGLSFTMEYGTSQNYPVVMGTPGSLKIEAFIANLLGAGPTGPIPIVISLVNYDVVPYQNYDAIYYPGA